MTTRSATQFKAECMRRLREKHPAPTRENAVTEAIELMFEVLEGMQRQIDELKKARP